MSRKEIAIMIVASANEIAGRLKIIAKQIDVDYMEKKIDIICLTNSAMFFCSDLVREIRTPVELHLLSFENYKGENKNGQVKLTLDINSSLMNRHVIVVEGIVVSGRTPNYIISMLSGRAPASISLCALGVKRKLMTENLPLKYCAFELGDEITVGYGVGNNHQKCLPYLTTLKQ
jgi:hypoxanthine phosphoribosyltransferase